MVKIGVYQHGIGWSYEQLKSFWVAAEQLGFDHAWMMDNNVYKNEGTGEWMPVFETWTLLPALAEATQRIRLGPLVTPCRRRHPALLAKITATFDHISNGRLDLGLGTGGDRHDHYYWRPWGMTFPQHAIRLKVLREEIAVLKKMWTETEANFEGEYYTLRNANNDPKPVQRPHPPIWIGIVLGKRVMPRLAAEMADGINIYNASDTAATELLASVDHCCRERGRDFNAIQKSRSVHVIMKDSGSPLELPDLSRAGPGSLPSVIGSAEELALERATTLDQQRQRMNRAKGLSKQLEVYSRITERHVIGSSDQVAAELVRIASAGFDQLIIQGLNSIDDLSRFAETVMPKVKGKP